MLDNDCYASLAAVVTQIQYGSVSRSHELLRCMATRLNPVEAGGHIVPLQSFALLCQNCLLFLSELISQHKSAFGSSNSKLFMKIDEKPT